MLGAQQVDTSKATRNNQPDERSVWSQRVHVRAAAGTKAHAVDTIRLVFHSDQGATDLISLLSLTNAK